MPSGQKLFAVTALKGRIACCNVAFIEVSGFSREELRDLICRPWLQAMRTWMP